LRYKGSYIDGRYFGDLNKFDTITFQPGYEKFISGFEDAVLTMNNKGKAKVIIPYYNAYGKSGRSDSYGSVSIPPYTSLCYEIEIISVK
jgi:FKBP-type peptidyl-prolyl cis-trans isomerase